MEQENSNLNADNQNTNNVVNEQSPQVNAPSVNINNQNNNTGKTSEKAKQIINSSNKKSRRVIVIIAVIIAAFFIFKVVSGTNFIQKIINHENVISDDKIDTGYKWGDLYASYIKNYYNEFNISKFDVSFVDFNFDNTPEMVLKYEDDKGSEEVRVFQINNKEVTETKWFFNSKFVIVYSSLTGSADWYIYITTSGKYGAYTMMNKILEGVAKTTDIKATSEKELTNFNKTYLVSDYSINYYEIKQSKFLSDFQVIVDRYKDYNTEAKNAKEKLLDDTANWQNNGEDKEIRTYLTINGYRLPFGTYKATVREMELGVIKDVQKTIILRDGYINVEGVDIKYTDFDTSVYLENSYDFVVVGDGAFKYGPNKWEFFLQE